MRHNIFFLFVIGVAVCSQAIIAQTSEEPGISPKELLKEEQRELVYSLALSLQKEDRIGEAISQYTMYLDLYPDGRRVFEIRSILAKLYERKQHFAKAARIWLTMYQDAGIAAHSLEYYFEYARLQEITGNMQEAEKVYREINQLSPDSDSAVKARLKLQAMNLFGESSSGEKPAPSPELKPESAQELKSSPQKE